MKTFEDRPENLDLAAIDRLVAGDLPEPERRELLLRLEDDPDGWRRCALAFLEDQAWRQALGSPSAVPDLAPSAPARVGRSWPRRLAIAASLMASTFAAGRATRGWPGADRPVEVAVAKPSAKPGGPTARPGEIREVGSLELVDGSSGEAPPDRFPIRTGPGLDERWLRSQPPTVPDYVRASLERQGYQVAERRKLMSVEVGGGRHVSVPVDEVEVDYVGQKPL